MVSRAIPDGKTQNNRQKCSVKYVAKRKQYKMHFLTSLVLNFELWCSLFTGLLSAASYLVTIDNLKQRQFQHSE